MKLQVGITGVGYNVPPSIRTNDDPIFDWLHAHVKEELFKGFKERRVLPGPGTLSALEENVADLMISAAKQALARAETDAADVDLLLGWASISPYLTPNALTLVHRELRLRQNAWLIPVEGLENFSTALMLADSLIKAEMAGTALVVSGCNWSQYVDYHTEQSISAGDGAGAAVLGKTRTGLFSVLDAGTTVRAGGYGAMFMQADQVPGRVETSAGSPSPPWTSPYFHLPEAGKTVFRTFGVQDPAELGKAILQRNGLDGQDVTLITHQASKVLMDIWKKQINPYQYIDTLASWGNMVSATVPVNFAHAILDPKTAILGQDDTIQKDYVLFLNPSAEFKAVGLLLKRIP